MDYRVHQSIKINISPFKLKKKKKKRFREPEKKIFLKFKKTKKKNILNLKF